MHDDFQFSFQAPQKLAATDNLVYRSAGFHSGAVSLDANRYFHWPERGLAVAVPESVLGAVNKRKSEFIAGRLCAMDAAQALSGQAAQIPIKPDRSPAWPAGLVGSISHSNHHAAALVGRASEFLGIGLDLEELIKDDLAAQISTQIVNALELALRPAGWTQAQFLTLAFSAKEALYKALYPLQQRYFDFLDVQLIRLDAQTATLKVAAAFKPAQIASDEFAVQFSFADSLCTSVALVRP